MSIKVNVGMEKTITESVYGGFTTNHPEDVVREWMNSIDWEDRTDELGFPDTLEEEWKTIYVEPEEYDEDEEEDDEHIFDEEIQMWIDAGNNLTN